MDIKPRPTGLDLRYSEWITPPKFIKKFLRTLDWQDFVQYPDTNILKDALSKHHNVKNENIFLGPGSAECIKSIFECFDQGQSVVVSHPCFPMYDVYARQGAIHINHMWPDAQHKYDPKHFTGGTFALVTRPASPLNHCFTRKQIIEILEQNSRRWVVVDEAYIEYADDWEDIVDLIETYKNLIVCRSFSKTFGAAGIRVGYLLADPEVIKTITTFRQMYEISGPSMRYAIYLLENYKEVQKYCNDTIKERKTLVKLFEKKGYRVLSSHGNWIHIEQTNPLQDMLQTNNIHAKQDIELPYSECKWIRLTVGPGLTRLIKKIL
jgi:histidinol-phosphate aminotransferase